MINLLIFYCVLSYMFMGGFLTQNELVTKTITKFFVALIVFIFSPLVTPFFIGSACSKIYHKDA